ncbi:MAG: methyl-accepting chemotaxis protein [Chromatiales bacterium]|nr:methyl-accepting chemotaxis protein [Chromatiales bacterium]
MNIKTIRGKVFLIFLTFVAALFLSAIFMLYQNSVVEEMEHDLVDNSYPGIMLAHRLKFHTVQVQQWLTDISATRAQNGLNDGFAEAKKHADAFKQVVEEIRMKHPEIGEKLDGVMTAFTPYYETGKRMAQSYIDNGPAGGNVVMSDFDGVAATINEKVDGLLEQLQEQVDQDWEGYRVAKGRVTTTIVIAVLVLLAIFSYFTYIVQTITNAMKEMGDEFTRLGQGDFGSRARSIDERSDELGEMGRNIGTMKQQLRGMVSEIGESASLLNSCIHSLTDVTSRTMLSVQQQQMETEQVAAAVTEMSANSREVAANASMAADSSRGANDSANSGNRVVQETVHSIESLATSVTSASEAIHKLEQDSESIGSILEVIRGIADQTNLLALNAAIEAARAGEQGRGFAVVADEVRTLASRTRDATGDIHTMIEQLQKGAADAVTVMEAGREKTKESVDFVQDARSHLNEIMTAVKTISDMSTQIAAAAEEQSSVAEEVSRNTNNISAENTRNAGSVQEIVNSTDELAALSQRLDGAVASFKIS